MSERGVHDEFQIDDEEECGMFVIVIYVSYSIFSCCILFTSLIFLDGRVLVIPFLLYLVFKRFDFYLTVLMVAHTCLSLCFNINISN